MPERLWYRSLYWRIAAGYVGLLAVLLVAEMGIVLQLSNRLWGRAVRSPAQLANLVAQDLSRQLRDQPEFDVDSYLKQHYGTGYQPFEVALAGERRISRIFSNYQSPSALLPPMLARDARRRANSPKSWAKQRLRSIGSREFSASVPRRKKTWPRLALRTVPILKLTRAE